MVENLENDDLRRAAEVLRGVLYLAQPKAAPKALTSTARAIAHRAGDGSPLDRAATEAVGLAASVKRSSRSANVDLTGAALPGADLFGADLRGARLSRANLSRANLFAADLAGADLVRANLSGAELNADLSGANLSGADLSGANLSGANLSRADLTATALNDADARGADLSGANLSGADLSGANLSGADLTRVDLSGANLVRTRWTRATQWPGYAAQRLLALSDEVEPGVFLVRGEPTADRTGGPA
ncbi:pentapeptide repeat-containing protein [Kitasatospora sp. NPDC008115]|uniref:pentapeptide repeat-containing protein n=1 Tax=Kitasatospora sp. NPDC008115 TaxID=3364022 RepID=UPI0036E23AD4